MVVVTGNNNEKLSTSELLKTKQSAWKNVVAQLKEFGNFYCTVQDNALVKPKLFCVYQDGKKDESFIALKAAPQVK
jgi:hypothetical protein